MAYVVTGWLLLQIVDVIGPGFGWPESVTALLTKILLVGFPIILVFAWLYELTPKGFKRTGRYQEETTDNKKAGRWLTNFIIGILAIALCFMIVERVFFAGSHSSSRSTEASIAVLPFRNDSPDEKNAYFCDGISEGVRENLSRIPSLSVVSRTSVERFRENPPSVAKIAEELGVQYVLEGSVLREEDRSVIRARLIFASEDRHLWSREYDRELEDIFSVMAEVTKNIAEELETTISPEVLNTIEEKPTEDLTAYDYYLQGKEFMIRYSLNLEKGGLEQADRLFQKALALDPTFARAFTERTLIFRERHQFEFYKKRHLIDSMLYLCNKGISLDANLADAYYVRGAFYDDFLYDIPRAMKDLNSALELNPNHTRSLSQLFWVTKVHQNNPIEALKLLKRIEKLDRSVLGLGITYAYYATLYWDIGEREKAYGYVEKSIELRPIEKGKKAWFHLLEGRFGEAISLKMEEPESNEKLNAIGLFYSLAEDNEKALEYFQRWAAKVNEEGVKVAADIRDWHRYGKVLLSLGREAEGKELLYRQLDVNEELGTNFQLAYTIYYENAGIYATLGDEKQAIEYLIKFDSLNRWDDGRLDLIQIDPMFDNIREHQQFKDIIRSRREQNRHFREEIARLEAAGEL